MSYRVSPQFKRLLEVAAATERRSQTNFLEILLFDYCEAHCIKADQALAQPISQEQE
ncbi:hypothetical protein [Cupriavidus necator]